MRHPIFYYFFCLTVPKKKTKEKERNDIKGVLGIVIIIILTQPFFFLEAEISKALIMKYIYIYKFYYETQINMHRARGFLHENLITFRVVCESLRPLIEKSNLTEVHNNNMLYGTK